MVLRQNSVMKSHIARGCRHWWRHKNNKFQRRMRDVPIITIPPQEEAPRDLPVESPGYTNHSLLDVESLSKDWEALGISSYKCRNRYREFLKTVEEANEEAKAKRQKLDEILKSHLKTRLETAKFEEDDEVVKAITEALESIGDGGLGGDETVVGKLRKSYGAQLEQIDKALFTAALNAARALHASLDYQKQELKKKGDAKKGTAVATFQAKVVAWGKKWQVPTPSHRGSVPSRGPQLAATAMPSPNRSVASGYGRYGNKTRMASIDGRTWTYTVFDNGFATIGDGKNVAPDPAPIGDLEVPSEMDGHPIS